MGVRDATEVWAACPQTAYMEISQKVSEDCLFLKCIGQLTKESRPAPVMVWIHGGSLTKNAVRYVLT